ncbi:MAG: GTP-binding protein [Candidatus Hodarchaeales archaeon]
MEVSSIRNEYLLKVCAVGSGNVGKSEVLRRFGRKKFTRNYLPTLGVDITSRNIEIDDYLVKLVFVVTTGNEFFGNLRPSYYRGASAGIIFFTLNDRISFNAVPKWLNEFREKVTNSSVPIYLIAIKRDSIIFKFKSFLRNLIIDWKHKMHHFSSKIEGFNRLKRSPRKKIQEIKDFKQENVSSEEALALAQNFGISYREIGLKNPVDFEKCIIELSREAIEKRKDQAPNSDSSLLTSI